MSKRSRPQPITAPTPESFLPTFDFGAAPKPRTSAPLPPRKAVKLSKRLAAFTFLNLEDIVEEGGIGAGAGAGTDDSRASLMSTPSVDPLVVSPVSSHTNKSRFWDFSKTKHSSPVTPSELPPMSSKAYATLVGGNGSKSPPRSAAQRFSRIQSPVHNPENPKSLAVDLVSIFSLSTSDEADPYNTRFSFPMPPSFTPRRGSQSPLDPEMAFTSMMQSPLSPLSPDSLTSGTTDYSFFSPLWSASFTAPIFPPSEITLPPLPEKAAIQKETDALKRRSLRPVLSLIPPAGPPPRDSPPPTPSSATDSPCTTDRLDSPALSTTKRTCPSPDLDPELSAVESASSSIASILLGLSNSGSDSSTDEFTDAEEHTDTDTDKVNNIFGDWKLGAPSRLLGLSNSDSDPSTDESTDPKKHTDTDRVNIFGDWSLGAPSRSGSIVTITQRAVNAAIHRGSLSTVVAGNTGSQGRNGSVCSDMYDNWEQAIDDIFAIVSTSRKPSLTASRRPSLASIALAASADGAASASTSLDVVEDTAFVMDEEMMRKLMESQFLVPSRTAPAPPSPTSGSPSLCESASKSTTSLVSTASASMDATPSASNTSSTRSSFEEDSSSGSALNQGPLTPIQEDHLVLEADPTLLSRPRRARPVPVVTSPTYPPVTGLRLARTEQGLSSANNNADIPPNALARSRRTAPLVTERLPPTQSVPDEDAFFSPLSNSSTHSPFSPTATSISPFSPPVNIDSWPTWSSIDDAIESKRRERNARRPSGGAATIMSKFSDDSLDIIKPRKHRMKGVSTKSKLTSPLSKGMMEEGEDVLEKRLRKNGMIAAKVNLSPGSSHTNYTFLGMKKKKDANTSPTSKSPPPVKSSKPRTSWESNTSGSSDGKKTGLRRPPLPLELFIRA